MLGGIFGTKAWLKLNLFSVQKLENLGNWGPGFKDFTIIFSRKIGKLIYQNKHRPDCGYVTWGITTVHWYYLDNHFFVVFVWKSEQRSHAVVLIMDYILFPLKAYWFSSFKKKCSFLKEIYRSTIEICCFQLRICSMMCSIKENSH